MRDHQLADLHGLIRSRGHDEATAQDFAFLVLRDAIEQGVLPPGLWLRQEALASAFATSRIPIRDALHRLEYEGLVRNEPRRGFFVTELSGDDIEEILELRTVLETHALQLALPLLTEDDIRMLRQRYERMEQATEVDRIEAREEFYLSLYSISARPRLVRMIMGLRSEVARSFRLRVIQTSPTTHQQFFDAVCRQDADGATAILAQHYARLVALQRRFLREDNLLGRGALSSQRPMRERRKKSS